MLITAAWEGESDILLDLTNRWRVEVLKPSHFHCIDPLTSEHRMDCDLDSDILVKEARARGIAASSKAQGVWQYEPAVHASDLIFVHISFPES